MNDRILKSIIIGITIFLVFSGFNVSLSKRTEPLIDGETTRFLINLDGDTLYVGGSGLGNYSKIQYAIDNASDGDTVFVYSDSSPYYENVVVNKTIHLIGEDRSTTVIDAKEIGSAVIITSNQVNISGFTMQNSGSAYGDSGIRIFSHDNVISNNIIGGDNNFGILLVISNGNTIQDNIVSSNRNNGIDMQTSCNNNISNNSIIYNQFGGIELHHYSKNNTISDSNIIERNIDDGIRLRHGNNDNIIINNHILHNGAGIGFMYSNARNLFYHNNFINNTQDVIDEDGTSIWDNSYPFGGNYWDNYNGSDEYNGPEQNEPGPDGIGDTPFNMSDNNQDSYPFMEQDGWKDVCSYFSFVTLPFDRGILTCPAGDGPPYQYITIICNNFDGEPIPGISADLFEFTVNSTGDAQWYDTLSCMFIAVDPETKENGEICFEVVGETSIIGNITVEVTVDGFLLNDSDVLPCKSVDLSVDGDVNLIDFVMFARDWIGTAWRSDFDWNGNVNLIDFVMFARHWGHQH